MEKLLKIVGLHCANCARELEEELQELKGINAARVDFVMQSVWLDFADETAYKKAVKHINRFEQVRVLDEGEQRRESHKKEIITIALSAIFFLCALIVFMVLKNTLGKAISYTLFSVSYLVVGLPVLISTAKNLVKGKVFDENFLMTVASIGALCLGVFGGEGTHGAAEGVAVMLLYQLGELLQAIAVGSSRKSVESLMRLKSENATVLLGEEQLIKKAEEVEIGEILLVKAGEKVPVDGVLLSETALVDTKSMTGEPEAKSFEKEDELLSGYINTAEVFQMRASRKYEQSAVQKILDMVENASAKKAAPEKFITKFAKIYTPVVCILALVVAFFAPVAFGAILDKPYRVLFPRFVLSALNFLVISCPCALVISVPLTYFCGIGACAKRGILIKGATHLDGMSKIKTVAFDKTGTLTSGEFSIKAVYTNQVEEQELIKLATSLEKFSSHPLAKAFEGQAYYPTKNVFERAGKGLQGEVDEKILLAGSAAFLRENGVVVEEQKSDNSLIYIAFGGAFLGVIEIGDTLRSDAKTAMETLRKTGVERIAVLTGDNAVRAEKLAKELPVDEIYTNLLPEDKQKAAEKLKERGNLLYVGDGINDAPVMASADIAVSMGKLGSAAAVEASDVVLIADKLSTLPTGIKIAKKTRQTVVQNIVFSLLMKGAFMILGLCGVLPLWLAVFADVGVMLLAVLNSLKMKLKIGKSSKK